MLTELKVRMFSVTGLGTAGVTLTGHCSSIAGGVENAQLPSQKGLVA